MELGRGRKSQQGRIELNKTLEQLLKHMKFYLLESL